MIKSNVAVSYRILPLWLDELLRLLEELPEERLGELYELLPEERELPKELLLLLGELYEL